MCQSCEAVSVNGVLVHEAGCPDEWKDYEVSCKWCGTTFRPEEKGQTCCSHTCYVAYNNLNCDCSECNPDEEE